MAVGASSDRTLGAAEQEEQIHYCLFGSLFLINILLPTIIFNVYYCLIKAFYEW